MPVSTNDRSEILDLLARYCWTIDEGEGDAWANLWTEDGQFTGIPDPLSGRDQLKMMPGGFHQMGAGKFRHHISNPVIDQGANADEATVKAYSVVTNWTDGGSLMGFAKANYSLVRQGGGWKIKALHAQMGL